MSYHSELSLMRGYRTCGDADEARRVYPTEYRIATEQAAQVAQARTTTITTIPTLTLDTVPAVEVLLALAAEHSATAEAHGDMAGVRQMNRVRANLLNGVQMHLHLGELLVQSARDPGEIYGVNARRCTCPNGQAGRSGCWHVALYGLVEELHQASIDERDAEAVRAELLAQQAEPKAKPTPKVKSQTGPRCCGEPMQTDGTTHYCLKCRHWRFV